jgi:hypothetical protein
MSAVACDPAEGITKIIPEYMSLALVAFAYVVLRRMDAKQGVSAIEPSALPRV